MTSHADLKATNQVPSAGAAGYSDFLQRVPLSQVHASVSIDPDQTADRLLLSQINVLIIVPGQTKF